MSTALKQPSANAGRENTNNAISFRITRDKNEPMNFTFLQKSRSNDYDEAMWDECESSMSVNHCLSLPAPSVPETAMALRKDKKNQLAQSYHPGPKVFNSKVNDSSSVISRDFLHSHFHASGKGLYNLRNATLLQSSPFFENESKFCTQPDVFANSQYDQCIESIRSSSLQSANLSEKQNKNLNGDESYSSSTSPYSAISLEQSSDNFDIEELNGNSQSAPFIFVNEENNANFAASTRGSAFLSQSANSAAIVPYRQPSASTKRKRMRMTPEQLRVLQKAFSQNPMPTANCRAILARKLGMTIRSVQIWFQNRRAKVKHASKVKDDFSSTGKLSSEYEIMRDSSPLSWQAYCHSFPTGIESLPHDPSILSSTPRLSNDDGLFYHELGMLGIEKTINPGRNNYSNACMKSFSNIPLQFHYLSRSENNSPSSLLNSCGNFANFASFPSDEQLYFGDDSIYAEQANSTLQRNSIFYQGEHISLPALVQNSTQQPLGRSSSFSGSEFKSLINNPALIKNSITTEISNDSKASSSDIKNCTKSASAEENLDFEENSFFVYPDPLDTSTNALQTSILQIPSSIDEDGSLSEGGFTPVVQKTQRSFSTSAIQVNATSKTFSS